jgi:nucleotide-binding universal stress UspA family protein
MVPTLPCPLPLDKILVCTDDSPASLGAVRAASDLAQACSSRIFLLYALEFLPYYEYSQPDALGMTPTVGQDFLELRQQAAREHLEQKKKEAAQEGLDMEIRFQTGSPVYGEILAAADDIQPQLIIMGRRGKSGLERLLVGSVTARVIGSTLHKVLVVPRNAVLSLPAAKQVRLPWTSPNGPEGNSPRSPPVTANWTPSKPKPSSGNWPRRPSSRTLPLFP